MGLSPRVRGNPLSETVRGVFAGPIPAGAGEPRLLLRRLRRPRAYPRGCGGTSCVIFLITIAVGLSPRVRGNLL